MALPESITALLAEVDAVFASGQGTGQITADRIRRAVEDLVATSAATEQTMAYAAAVTVALDTSPITQITATGDISLSFSGGTAGQRYRLAIIQGGSGGNRINFTNAICLGPLALNNTALTQNIFDVELIGTTYYVRERVGTRHYLTGMFLGASGPTGGISKWLGYHPDYQDSFGGGTPGGSIFPPDNGDNVTPYPTLIGTGLATAWNNNGSSITYASIAAGSHDSDILTSLASIRAFVPYPSQHVLMFRPDFEFNTSTFAIKEGPAVFQSAFNHAATVIKSVYPQSKVVYCPSTVAGSALNGDPNDFFPSGADIYAPDCYFFKGVDSIAATAAAAWKIQFGDASTDPNAVSNANLIVNPTFAGAANPSTLPTNWTQNLLSAGTTLTIIGTGTEFGMPFMDIQWSGTTPGGGGFLELAQGVPFTSGGVPADPLKTMAFSFYCRVVGGATTNIVGAYIHVAEGSGTGGTTPITTLGFATVLPTANLQFINLPLPGDTSNGRALDSGTTTVWPIIGIQASPSAAINLTLRLYNPRLATAAPCSLASMILFAKTKGVPVVLPEWGDSFQSTGDLTAIQNMAAVINDKSNNIIAHTYWNSSDSIPAGGSAILGAQGQAIFARAFGGRYDGTVFSQVRPPTNFTGF